MSNIGYSSLIKSASLSKAVLNTPNVYWMLSLDQILNQYKPTNVDIQIKHRFWVHINTGTNLRPIKLSDLINGICTKTNFYNHFKNNPYKLVWLFNFEAEIKYSMWPLRGPLYDKISKILELEVKDKNGTAIPKNIAQILNAFQLIEGVVTSKMNLQKP